MRTIDYRCQRTIAQCVEVQGVGFLTGASVRLRFRPAPANTGVVFVRTDLQPTAFVAACLENVTGTQRRTTLGQLPIQVALVEHVLAALAGLRIDNCYVEVNAPEPPGLDGSAWRFVEGLRSAGFVPQDGQRPIRCVDVPMVVQAGSATLALHPGPEDELKISYVLDYGSPSPISRQSHTQTITPEGFINDLADCRTFILDSEAPELRRQGIGTRVTAADLLVIGPRGPIDNHYRHGNELVRHKILDIVGDLALLNCDLRGHVVAYRSGHPLNIELGRQLSGSVGLSRRLSA